MENKKVVVIGTVGVVGAGLVTTALAIGISHIKKKNSEIRNTEALLCCADELPVVNSLPQLSPEYLTLLATSKKR